MSREFPWVQVAALARANTTDIERAADSLENARRPRIHTFIATSDIHLNLKLKKSRQQVLDEASRPLPWPANTPTTWNSPPKMRREPIGIIWNKSRVPWWPLVPAR